MCIACDNNNYGFLCPECQDALVKVIKRQRLAVKQCDTHKLVRMADGSRKWLSNAEAAPLLKLARTERK